MFDLLFKLILEGLLFFFRNFPFNKVHYEVVNGVGMVSKTFRNDSLRLVPIMFVVLNILLPFMNYIAVDADLNPLIWTIIRIVFFFVLLYIIKL